MLHIYDKASLTHALNSDLSPPVRSFLQRRTAELSDELKLLTEFLVLSETDTDNDMIQHIGFSIFAEPFDGARYGTPAFWPHWDWLAAHPGFWEFHFTFGSSFAYIVIVADEEGLLPELRSLCREFADPG